MFPGMNSRQAQQMMKKMGVKSDEIDAIEVIVKLEDRQLVFKQPSLSKVNMMGQETFQLSGDYVEEAYEVAVNDDDISTVMEQANVSKEEAVAAIKKHNGDLAEAILELQD